VLLAIEIGLRYHMCDLHSKFQEDWTKTAVVIVDDRYLDRRTDRHSSDFTSVQCHALHSTDNKYNVWK